MVMGDELSSSRQGSQTLLSEPHPILIEKIAVLLTYLNLANLFVGLFIGKLKYRRNAMSAALYGIKAT